MDEVKFQIMWFHKQNTWLLPNDEPAEKWLARIEEGEMVCMKLLSVRSGPWHRWYFACCRSIGFQQEPERSEFTIDYSLRFWSGHVEETRDHNGRVLEVAKRLAFDKLSPSEWETLWPSLEKTMLERYGFDPVKFKETGNGWL